MASTKLSDLSAAAALAATDLFYVVQTAGAGGVKATGTQLLTLVGTTYVAKAGDTMTGRLTITQGTANTAVLASTGYSLTGSDATSLIDLAATWNTTGTPAAIKLAITNTASNSASLALNILAGAAGNVSIFSVRASDGRISGFSTLLLPDTTIGVQTAGGLSTRSTGYYGWNSGSTGSANPDTVFYRDAAGTIAQRNSTNAQTLRIYGTYTDASNYERLALTTTAGSSVNLLAETAGTGADNLDIVLTPVGTGAVKIGSNGTKTAPSFAMSGDATVGFYYRTTALLAFAGNSRECIQLTASGGVSANHISFGSNNVHDFSTTSRSFLLQTQGANILGLVGSTATNAQTLQVYVTADGTYQPTNYERLTLTGTAGSSVNILAETAGTGGDNLDIKLTAAGTGQVKAMSDLTRVGANAQSAGIYQLSELTTIAAAATTDTAIQMPAGAIILGVTVRVTTAITCTSTFDVGDSGNATRFGTGISKAANTTNVGSVAPYLNASALAVRITPDTTPSDNTGRVRVTIHYMLLTAATS